MESNLSDDKSLCFLWFHWSIEVNLMLQTKQSQQQAPKEPLWALDTLWMYCFLKKPP